MGEESYESIPVHLGVAGWAIAKANAELFPTAGTHLERYAATFRSVEINSSFRQLHQAKTYARWAATVPPEFRFSVKLSRTLTHDGRLHAPLTRIREQVEPILSLGEKLGVILVQLPPGLAFEPEAAEAFFGYLRELTGAPIACEPRHETWLAAAPLLARYRVAKVEADPAMCPDTSHAFRGTGPLRYVRLHGSPKVYYSEYGKRRLRPVAESLRKEARPAWVIFDNTADFHAAPDALRLRELLTQSFRPHAAREMRPPL